MIKETKKLKKFLKNKIKVTMSLLIGFMMTGGLVFAATPLKDDVKHLITSSNTATGGMTTVAIGGQNNKIETSNGWGEAIIGGYNNKISGAGNNPNVILGSINSIIGNFDAQDNPTKTGNETHRSTIIGGQNHIVKGYDNIVLGGGNNNLGTTIGGNQILGGDNNAILGGMENKIDQIQSIYYTNNNILGGKKNTISDTVINSSILNGEGNTISGTAQNSAILSGMKNIVKNGINSVVVAGNENTIKNSKQNNGIFAGLGNTIDNVNHRNAIIGGQNSKISGTAGNQGFDNVIIGGGDADKGANEIINNDNSTVIGGYKNIITGNANDKYQDDNIILGGHTNNITGTAKDSAILAGTNNTASGLNSVVVGGAQNIASGKGAVVIGGGFYENGTEIGNIAAALNSSVLGGVNNQISESAYRSSIIGGYINNVSSIDSIILGGHHNTVEGNNSAIIAGNKNSTTAKDSLIFGGFNNNITEGSKNFILGGVNNTVSGAFSGAIGGDGNNVSGSKSYTIGSTNIISGSTSYAFGNSNNVLSEVDYIIGENNEIAGSHNYIIGSNNISTQEKVYILGSDVDASGVANAVVLGDSSKAVENAVSVGTEAAPRNIKHVKDGEISDTSLDAINGSQVTTITEKGTVDDTYIAVERDPSKENGTDPHIVSHKKHYKIGLTKEATDAITNAKKIPQLETAIKGKLDKDSINDILSTDKTIKITGKDLETGNVDLSVNIDGTTITKNDKGQLVANVTDTNSIETVTAGDGIEVSGGTEAKNKNWTVGLSDKTKEDIKEGKKHSSVSAGTNVESVTSEKTNSDGGKEYVVNVKDMHVTSGTVKYTDDGTGTATLTHGDGTTATVTGLKDTKVTGLTLADTTLTLGQNNGEKDLTVDLSGLKTNISDIVSTDKTVIITGKDLETGNVDLSVNIDGTTITKNDKGQLVANVTDTNSIETVTAGDGIEVSGGTEAKDKNWTVALSDDTKAEILAGKKHSSVVAGTNVESVTSTGTNVDGGKEYIVNVKDMHVTSGTVKYTDDGTGTATLTHGDGTTATVTGLKDTKVTGLTLADTTLTLVQNNEEKDLTVDLSGLKTNISDIVSTDKTVIITGKDLETGNVDLSVNLDKTTITKNDKGELTAKTAKFVKQGDDIKLNGDDGLVKASDMLGILNDSVSKETVSAGYGIKVTPNKKDGKNRNFEVALSDDIVKKIDSASAGAASGMAMAGIPQVTYDRLVGIGAGAAYYGGQGAFALGLSGQNRARNFVWKVNGSVSTKGTLGASAGFNVSLGKIDSVEKVAKVKDMVLNNNADELNKLKERVAKLEASKSIKFIVNNFVLDKDNITSRQLEKLKYVVETINTNYPNSVIEIHGFTDIQYKDKYNMDLGLRRARNGKAILVELGLKNENIIVLSKGYNEMLDGSYGENRRIEILVNNFDKYVK